MTGWEFFANIIKTFSPVVVGLVVIAAVIVFIVGFWRRGMDFIKHGFRGVAPESSLEKRLDDIAANMATKEDLTKMATATKEDMDSIRTEVKAEIQTIKVNHFGHLKNFLTELTSILLDKGIINNENKARLDNQLRDM
jgi:K+ transporter